VKSISTRTVHGPSQVGSCRIAIQREYFRRSETLNSRKMVAGRGLGRQN